MSIFSKLKKQSEPLKTESPDLNNAPPEPKLTEPEFQMLKELLLNELASSMVDKVTMLAVRYLGECATTIREDVMKDLTRRDYSHTQRWEQTENFLKEELQKITNQIQSLAQTIDEIISGKPLQPNTELLELAARIQNCEHSLEKISVQVFKKELRNSKKNSKS